ncbi:MAG: guanylate kinase [Chloroflexota bacterium]|jgi:guanylate kinase|nr:MAG: guanylate kinase [Chloroflexota bacterium]
MSDNDLYPPQHSEPLLIVISGPSGVGKDSVIKSMKERDLPFHFVVTATSRSPRENEQHGVDYFFISQEEFIQMIEEDELLEHAIVYGDYKGIPKEQVRQALASGKDVVMRIDVQGAATIRDISPEALLIFLTTQNESEMIERLKLRKTETTDGLQNRIAIAREELKRKSEFDYVVVNRDSHLEEAVDTILAIIRAEHHRTTPKKVTL